MGGAALGVVHSCLREAEIAVYGVADVGGIGVILAIVLPPTDRAQTERAGRVQSPEAAARALITSLCCPHARNGRNRGRVDYEDFFEFHRRSTGLTTRLESSMNLSGACCVCRAGIASHDL